MPLLGILVATMVSPVMTPATPHPCATTSSPSVSLNPRVFRRKDTNRSCSIWWARVTSPVASYQARTACKSDFGYWHAQPAMMSLHCRASTSDSSRSIAPRVQAMTSERSEPSDNPSLPRITCSRISGPATSSRERANFASQACSKSCSVILRLLLWRLPAHFKKSGHGQRGAQPSGNTHQKSYQKTPRALQGRPAPAQARRRSPSRPVRPAPRQSPSSCVRSCASFHSAICVSIASRKMTQFGQRSAIWSSTASRLAVRAEWCMGIRCFAWSRSSTTGTPPTMYGPSPK